MDTRGTNMKRLSVSICALLVCLNMSACDVVQANTPTPSVGTTSSAPISDVYPTQIESIISETQDLNEQVFAPDFTPSSAAAYAFEGSVSDFSTNESNIVTSFMVETEWGAVRVENPVVSNEEIDPDIRAQYDVSDKVRSAKFYASYAGYDQDKQCPYFTLGDAWCLGYTIRETAIQKKDLETLIENYTPDTFPSFALDIYPEDAPEAPEVLYSASTQEDCKDKVYTLTGIVSNNRMEELDALTQVRTATITTTLGEAVLIDQSGEFYGAPLRSMYMPPKNNSFVKAYVQYLGYSEEYGKPTFAIDGTIAKEKITDHRSSINEENLSLLTISDYNDIQIGMTLQQVEDTLNCAGTRSSSYESSLGNGELYEWEKDRDSIISVILVNGTVSSKSQVGL